ARYGAMEALHGVSLEVRQGEKVAVIGPNGAGKSTLLRTLSGLIRPSQGIIEFCGQRLDKVEPHHIPRLGMVQVPEARHIFPALTVEENLLVGGTVQPDAGARRETLAQVWELFADLRSKARLPAGSLSGGQQQMLAIGRALMSRPRLMLLDEPSLGLAPRIVDELFEMLERLVKQGLTVLLVEQDVYRTLEFVDRAYVIENGAIVLQQSAQDLLINEHVRRVYLGM
ncbi:MAG: ABC transporter ATP-binding protein, partial [Desulfobacterales bacterium]|nr:ABC transporter ATP-binding protein [Desulfobacterales bacterium]